VKPVINHKINQINLKRIIFSFGILLLLLNTGTAEVCECDSCKDCTVKLESSLCTDVKLINDMTITKKEELVDEMICIKISESANKIFDCRENEIKVPQEFIRSLPGSNGIYVSRSKNVTIKNCDVSGFWAGILFALTNDSKIINNTLSFNGIGISVAGFSYNNTVVNNKCFYNNDCGIQIFQSQYTNVSKNLVFSNGFARGDGNGISLIYETKFNEITDNKIYNNSGPGILVTGVGCEGSCRGYPGHKKVIGNKVINNEITGNTYGLVSVLSDTSVYSNNICGNEKSDFNSSDWMASNGNYNTCNNSGGWNDSGKEGCTYKCGESRVDYGFDYGFYLAILIIVLTIGLSLIVIWYRKFR